MKKLTLFFVFAVIAAAQDTLRSEWASASSTGTITTSGYDCAISSSCVWLVSTPGSVAAQVEIAGSYSGTLVFETATDGATWKPLVSTAGFGSTRGYGTFYFQNPSYLRVRASAFASGKALVTISTLSYVPTLPTTDRSITNGHRLLIYYGTPQGINGLWDSDSAAAVFSSYDYVVFGDGLELPADGNYATTKATLARTRAINPNIQMYGYIDLGVTTQNQTIATIKSKAIQWQALGVAGIFLDDSGYDFHVSRARQNLAVDIVHGLGLSVTMNAWNVDDALGSAVDATYNPTGAAPHLGSSDCYLLESWVVNTSAYSSASGWETMSDVKTRADAATAYRKTLGVKIMANGQDDWNATSAATEAAYFAVLEAWAAIYSIDGYGLETLSYGSVAPNQNVVTPMAYSAAYKQWFNPGLPYSLNGGWTIFYRYDLGLTLTYIDAGTHAAVWSGGNPGVTASVTCAGGQHVNALSVVNGLIVATPTCN
jgi:hypothetical protein